MIRYSFLVPVETGNEIVLMVNKELRRVKEKESERKRLKKRERERDGNS